MVLFRQVEDGCVAAAASTVGMAVADVTIGIVVEDVDWDKEDSCRALRRRAAPLW